MEGSVEQPIHVRLMADYAADPVWTDEGMADLEYLPISPRLRDDLREWAREWELILGPTFQVREKDSYRRWLAAGRRHALDLQKELGPTFEVEYRHELEDV
ncbi:MULTISPECIES: hypothetical protein [unclassified Knoellia]|uniref:hypothetical protein n=1 Tax=Knoellia altitudinis TaxID=3404795 RepID=UPI00360922A1